MKKLLLCITLATSVTGILLAQSIEKGTQWRMSSELDKRFTAPPYFKIQDVVSLDGARVLFELNDLKNYKSLAGLDTMLQQLGDDIAFYHDSLENGTAPVRIDYIVHTDKEYREIRFVKHQQNGDPFVKRNGNIERLKITDDTIRILMKKEMEMPEHWKGKFKHLPDLCLIQATFTLSRYSDIGHIIEQKSLLLHAIDTFISVRDARESTGYRKYAPHYTFRPYDTSTSLKHRRLSKSVPQRKAAQFYVNVCAGVVRNTLIPFADIGVSMLDLYPFERKHYFFTSLSASPFFFFERGGDRTYYMYDNWFVNLERGGVFEGDNALGFKARDYSYGIGYLAINNGSYFKDVTVKFFITATLVNGITLSPELIATNTFGQFFPGVTMKIKAINTYN